MTKLHIALAHVLALTLVHATWTHTVSATVDEFLLTTMEITMKVLRK